MHKYRQIEYKAGATIEIIKCIPWSCRQGAQKGEKKKSREEIRKANMVQAARKLTRKLNANFRPGDWHVILTYKDVPDVQTAKKYLDKFLQRLRTAYRKMAGELKYIAVTEFKAKRIHHHLVINRINDGKKTAADLVREIWRKLGQGNPKFVPLYDSGEYQGLAEYLIKETERTFRDMENPWKQRFSCSRNLVEPKKTVETKKIKNAWEMDPKPRKGYYIQPDSLYNGFDLMGYQYQRYVLVKINPTESDWEQPKARRRRKRNM